MKNVKYWRTALAAAMVAVIMLAITGGTLAWFTDEVTSTSNVIESGTLDVDVYYGDPADKKSITAASELFDGVALWEPGAMAWENLTVANLGTLALRYDMLMNTTNENHLEGNGLSAALKVGFVENGVSAGATREDVLAAVDSWTSIADFAASGMLLPADTSAIKTIPSGAVSEAQTIGMVVYWEPTASDNNWNPNNGKLVSDYELTGNNSLHIDLGVKVIATQLTAEDDAFGPDYDEDAYIEAANTKELQAILDGPASGTVIVLKPDVAYGQVYMGRPTKDNDTTMTCSHCSFTTTDAEAYKAHISDGKWHPSSEYTTTLKDVTIIGAEGATIDGLLVTSGHMYNNVYDHVIDETLTSRGYYATLIMDDITFLNVDFTGNVNINTSDASSEYSNVAFEGCTFTTGGIASGDGAAIRYYNESNNERVSNITVKNCTFTNCYQGVYVQNVNGVTVTGCSFDTTGHNAIALQSGGEAVNLKTVVITGNSFNNIKDRVIRFNNIGADSNITIQGNVATNSGDDEGEVIKAGTIASGITTSISGNNWGEGKTVVNSELQDK